MSADTDALAAHGWQHSKRDGDVHIYIHAERHGEHIRIQGKGWVHYNADGMPLAHSRYGKTIQEHLG